MRKRLGLLLCSGIVLLCLLLFLNWDKQIPDAPPITASAMGGYYSDAFLLELSAAGEGQIYYTTDGSRPTERSSRYSGGILITDRSMEPNKYNAMQNVVPDWKKYTPDPTPVAKGTVIRAVCINRWGRESAIFTQTYFVGVEPPADGYTLSLIFEEEDVFGTDGIYVTGADYDLWYVSGQIGREPDFNFGQKVKVPAIAELMDADGDITQQSLAMRIQGSSAVVYPKKRLALFAETPYSPSDIFDAEIFPGTQTHSVMLKNVVTDLMVSDLVQDRSVALQQNFPVRVYLNGEYWYDTYVMERFDNQYFQSHYGVKDILLVKDGTQEKTSERQLQTYYDEFMDWVENTDFSLNENWEQIQEKMDVQSYIDFFCINHYLCNLDWSQKANYVLWCSTEDTGSGFSDMRWRWCIYDIDNLPDAAAHFGEDMIAAVNPFTARTPWINTQTNEQSLFVELKRNPAFCRQFVLSFMDILNNNFAPDKTEAALLKYGYVMDWLNGFFRNRAAYCTQHLAEEFQLTGTLETVTVGCTDPQMGNVVVNTSCIDLSDGSWSGQYFTDYPITITATPAEGYAFIGWKGDAQSTAETITLSVDGGISLEAVFAKVQ